MTLLSSISAVILLIIFTGMIIFQILLALGKPYGHLAYGGKHDGVLPDKLRVMSVVSILIFILSSILVMNELEFLTIAFLDNITTIGLWVITLFLIINTMGNLFSKSKTERQIMTPITLIAFLCLLVILLRF